MPLLNRTTPTITDSEKLVRLAKDMMLLKQQLTSESAKRSQSFNAQVCISKEVDLLKQQLRSIHECISATASSQDLKQVQDKLDSHIEKTRSVFQFTMDGSQNIQNTLISHSDYIKNFSEMLNDFYNKLCRLELHVSSVRSELLTFFRSDLESFKKGIQDHLQKLPIPKDPIEEKKIREWIAEAMVLANTEAKDAADRSREVKMNLALLEKRLKRQVTY